MTRAWVDIDLGALSRNGATLAARAGVPLLAMVKADAYGLGAVPVARALEPLAPWGYGVATVGEGVALRDAGITHPIVVFTPLLDGELRAVRGAALRPLLSRAEDIRAWRSVGGGPWHLGVDTGMSRAGVRWDVMDSVIDEVRASPPEGACTHLHSAERDDRSAARQEGRFGDAIARLPARPPLLHAENSAAIARRARSHWDLVRPGVFLYGVGSGAGAAVEPEPVVRLAARVVDVRAVAAGETVSYAATFTAAGARRVATLAIGYADGYVRALGNRGRVIVNGRVAPVVGVVTMDMTMIDVTDVPCAIGDTATLVGTSGGVALSVEDVARDAGMSPYELLTGLRGRLAHVYHGAAGA
ncbi:MAG: alanine racemase [Gemmatimonadaceae bacterium]